MASPHAVKLAGRRVAEALDAAAEKAPPLDVDAELATLRQLRKERSARDRRTRQSAIVASLLAACLVTALVLVLRPRALSFTIDGGNGEVGRWIASPHDAPTTIAFSDGSSVDLHADGRARVVDVDQRGARVLLEEGVLTARVVHRERTSWTVAAGPFEVHVVGTSFEAAWSPASETLTITMFSGRVEVTGDCLETPKEVANEESVMLSCRGVVAPAPLGPVIATSTSAPAEPTSSVPAAVSAPSGKEPSASPAPSASWRDLAKKGKYEEALALAEQAGVLDRVSSLPVNEVEELAEVARLAGRADVARRLYAAVRDRDPGSDAAALAAFQLGRMTFGGSGAESERWFRTYLAERPNGPLAAEALGRIMEIEYKRGRAAAQDTAKRYLAQFPKGAHAALAKSILEP